MVCPPQCFSVVPALDEVRICCLTTVCCLGSTPAAAVSRDHKGQGKKGNKVNEAVIAVRAGNGSSLQQKSLTHLSRDAAGARERCSMMLHWVLKYKINCFCSQTTAISLLMLKFS